MSKKSGCGAIVAIIIAVPCLLTVILGAFSLLYSATDTSPSEEPKTASSLMDSADTPDQENGKAEAKPTPTTSAQTASAPPAAQPKPNNNQSEIERWRSDPALSESYPMQLARLLYEGEEIPECRPAPGSVGTFSCSFSILNILNSNTLLVNVMDSDGFPSNSIVLVGVSTSGLATDDRRSISGLAQYEGTQSYTTVLGAQRTVHTYRILPDSILEEAQRLAGLMREEDRVAANNQDMRESHVRLLLDILAQISQNTRGEYDQTIRERVASNYSKSVERVKDELESWHPADQRVIRQILDNIDKLENMYASDSYDALATRELAKNTINLAQSLRP